MLLQTAPALQQAASMLLQTAVALQQAGPVLQGQLQGQQVTPVLLGQAACLPVMSRGPGVAGCTSSGSPGLVEEGWQPP